jgi:hypothetical protein
MPPVDVADARKELRAVYEALGRIPKPPAIVGIGPGAKVHIGSFSARRNRGFGSAFDVGAGATLTVGQLEFVRNLSGTQILDDVRKQLRELNGLLRDIERRPSKREYAARAFSIVANVAGLAVAVPTVVAWIHQFL